MSTRVTLAMIVRDEMAMAPDFLESVRGLWDELVVVDTGSTDGTPEFFASHGAVVVHHVWQNDFAQARNVSLERATGDWVLVLDADERASADFVRAFRAATQDPTLGALTVRVSNPLPYGHRRESSILRAFRNDRSVRYRHAIHEDAGDDVNRMLARTGLKLGTVDPPVEHLGYVRSRAAYKEKKTRDLALLNACLEKDPLDYYSWLKVLELARYWRDSVLWRDSAARALDMIQQTGHSALTGVAWGGEIIALIAEGLFAAHSPKSLVLLDEWAPHVTPSATFFHRRGQCHEAQEHLAEARADFERCLKLGHALGDQQLAKARPALGLARLALMRGDFEQARRRARQAIDFAPRDPEALLAMAALMLHAHGSQGVARWAAEHAERVGACPERDWAIGEAAFAVGEVREAIVSLRLAAGVPPAGPAAVRLAQACLADGDLPTAEHLARTLMASEPEAGLGVLLFDLISGRDTAIDLDLTPETAQASMRHWVDALLMSENGLWVKKLSDNLGAVGGLFPWLPQYLHRTG